MLRLNNEKGRERKFKSVPGLALPSQLFQFLRQIFVCQLSLLRLLQQLLGLRHGTVPLVQANLAPELPLLQPEICLVIFHLRRAAVGTPLCFLPMGTHLTTGALGLAGSDIVAVADVVPSGQQEIPAAVVTAPGRIAVDQSAVEIGGKDVSS